MPNNSAVRIMQRSSRTFFNSARFLPPDIRHEVVTLYAFVRTADDFVDAVPQDEKGFCEFVSGYRSAVRGSSNVPPVISEFVSLADRRGFSPDWVDAFLNAMQSDLTIRTYATLEETLGYVYGSAESVGLMMARIMSLSDEALPYARLLGRAFQYVNFIRDVMEDLRLGRVYLPQSDILACGLPCLSHQTTEENPESFCGLIRMQLSRYRQWRAESDHGFQLIPSRYRAAILTARDMYDYTAGIIERDPMIVLRCKVKPTAARILVHGLANQIGVRL